MAVCLTEMLEAYGKEVGIYIKDLGSGKVYEKMPTKNL